MDKAVKQNEEKGRLAKAKAASGGDWAGRKKTNPFKLGSIMLSMSWFGFAQVQYRETEDHYGQILGQGGAGFTLFYNDLVRRGFDVDVGVVEQNCRDENGKKIRKQLEVDFVVNRVDERSYIQSALSIADPEKKEKEIASLIRIPDSFRKIVVVRDYMKPWKDENGIQYIGIEDFLLDESIIFP